MKRFTNAVIVFFAVMLLAVFFGFSSGAVPFSGGCEALEDVDIREASNDTITIGWTAIRGAESYNVYSYDDKKNECQLIGNTKTNSYSVSGCNESVDYRFAVTALINVDGVSYESSMKATPAVRISEMPEKLKKTYYLFRSGTFGINLIISLGDGSEYPFEVYCKDGNYALITRMGVESSMESKALYQKENNEGYTLVFTSMGNFYMKMTEEELESYFSLAESFAPDIKEGSSFFAKEVEYNGETVTCEGFTSESGNVTYYYFNSEGNLVAIEEITTNGNSSIMKVAKLSTDVDDSVFNFPTGFPIGWVCIDTTTTTSSSGSSDSSGSSNGVSDETITEDPSSHEHSYPESWLRFKNNCYGEGIEIKICDTCDKIIMQKTPHNPVHTPVATQRIEPTCIDSGYIGVQMCSSCEIFLEERKEIAAKGHTEEVVPGKPATCTEGGITDGKKCTVCNAVLVSQSEIPAKGHTEEILAAKKETCTENGLTEGKKCSACGLVTVEQYVIGATGHKETVLPAKKETCTEIGLTEGKKCSVCETITVPQNTIPAFGHNVITLNAVEAVCSRPGLTEGKQCTICDEVLVKQETVIAPHKEDVIPGIEATCTSIGLTEGKKCNVCNAVTVIQNVIPAKGHTEEIIPSVSATCTEKGLTEGKKCTVCGMVTVIQNELPETGHTEEIIPSVPETYTTEGLTEGKKCTACGEILEAQKKTERKILAKVKGVKVKKATSDSVTLTWKKVTGAESYKVYYSTNGKKWKSVKATKNSVTIKKLKSAKNYQFKVKAVAGKYSGEASKVLKKTTKFTTATLSKVTSSKKKQAIVTWKQTKNASGYVIEYSTSKKFTKKTTKTVKIKKGKTVKATLKKLKSGKKYYIRIKAYKTVNKKAVYGSYSKVKTVKIK